MSDLSESVMVRPFGKSDGSKSLKLLDKKSEWAKSDGSDSLLGLKRGKTVKNIRKIRIFEQIARFLRVNCSNHKRINLKFAICSRRSFVKSDISESLTVALLYRAMWVNRSWSLFKMSDFEWKSEDRMSERANFQPCGNKSLFYPLLLENCFATHADSRAAIVLCSCPVEIIFFATIKIPNLEIRCKALNRVGES